MNNERDLRFVGRSLEVAQIDAAITRKADHAPVVVCVSGPAGIGKTTLLEHVLSQPLARNRSALGALLERNSDSRAVAMAAATRVDSRDWQSQYRRF